MATQYTWSPQINRTRCTGCSKCIDICPTGALDDVKGRAAVVDPQACTYCAACEDACPTGAIELPYLIVFSDASLNQNHSNTERH